MNGKVCVCGYCFFDFFVVGAYFNNNKKKTAAEMTQPPMQSTFQPGTAIGGTTTTNKVATRIARIATAAVKHSPRTLKLNAIVTEFIKNGFTHAYDRFLSDRKYFVYYIHLKWVALLPVTDKQVKYHRVLGMGAFGTVNGCVVSHIGMMLALKSMSKKRIKLKRAKSQVTAERDALEALSAHPIPYCMRLRYAYETREAYNLIIPLAIGGDLKFHLKNGGFPHERAKMYAAEVALGIGHLHSLGMINRDLKPRNILLNSMGHCQISDFGLAVSIADGRTAKGRAGTEGYWSPEVINGLVYSIDADWWSYGVCVFEFIAGFSPFSCKHTGYKTRNEGTRKGEVKYPENFDETAKPLINALLNKDVSQRLGCKGRGALEVLDSELFAYWKSLDIAKIRRNEVPALWIPEKGQIYAASQIQIQENDDDAEVGVFFIVDA